MVDRPQRDLLGPEARRIVLNRRRRSGFTLVELMVSITIVAFGLALAMPSMSAMLQNAKLASTARTYFAGVQKARSEAIRLNQPVEFVLTDVSVSTSDLANQNPLKNASGPNWLVRYLDPASATGKYALVEAHAASEGALQGSGSSSVQIAGVQTFLDGPAFDGTIVFDGFGKIVAGSSYALDIKNPSGGACAASDGSGTMRCLSIRVTAGGQLQLCDPIVTTLGDSRRCQ